MMQKYSVLYNQKTWQWYVVLWQRSDPLDAWQGRAVAGYRDQREAELEAKRLTMLNGEI